MYVNYVNCINYLILELFKIIFSIILSSIFSDHITYYYITML